MVGAGEAYGSDGLTDEEREELGPTMFASTSESEFESQKDEIRSAVAAGLINQATGLALIEEIETHQINQMNVT